MSWKPEEKVERLGGLNFSQGIFSYNRSNVIFGYFVLKQTTSETDHWVKESSYKTGRIKDT